jgi:hypothetical protein
MYHIETEKHIYSRNIKSLCLAVAQGAMVSALGAALLTFGFALQLGEFFWYFWAMFLVMLLVPSRRWGIMLETVACTCLLFFCFTGFNFAYALPYVLMSVFVVIKAALAHSPVPRPAALALRIAFFDLSLIVIYYLTVLFVFPDGISERFVIAIILSAGSGIGLLWDFVMGKLQHRVVHLAGALRIGRGPAAKPAHARGRKGSAA